MDQHHMTHERRAAAPLLAAVASIRDTLAANMAVGDARATLAPASVAALRDAGLFAMKLPRVLGGAEADPVTQIAVLEALAAIDPAAAWCTMVGATGLAHPGAFLPDAAVAKIFPTGTVPTAAVVGMPAGLAHRVDGGYRLSGRWPFASGVRHAQWITLGVRVAIDGGEFERRNMTLPIADVVIHDNWQVAGLEATGSCDVSVADRFVPDDFSWNVIDPPRRGGPLYRLRNPGFVANEHAAVALGIARLALDTLVTGVKSRRGGAAAVLEKRPAFQRAIGEGELQLRAARGIVIDVFAGAWETLEAGDIPTPRQQAEMRAVATYATDVALGIVTTAFRHAGGSAVYRSHVLQRCLRDINVAAQHYMVSDMTYETLGAVALGLPGIDPMR